ncbi:hybrid signal transduction histidine kinase M [Tanacetum coccineum]|uniref:Hybrid signal transduction histidine kinase M n=1 Tax=Tanacetum coccineum TaxID=301880 RepID=A0ABQ5BXY3_9ASTR
MAVEDTPPPPPPPSTTDKIIPFSIPNKVPIKLDLEKHNYNSWSSFSLIHLGSLGLKSHVETDTASTNPEWCQLDDLIKMWILGSLCDSLQEQVVTTPGNAKALWDRLKELFHDNKDARAINLDNELRSIKIGKMTVNEYCTKIRSMADRLINLGCVVSDKNLVIYTINGLDSRFATLVEIIRNRETFPSFENVRTMLLLKESSFNNDSGSSTDFSSSSSSPTVLLASNQSNNKVQQPAQPVLFAAHQPHGYGTAQQQQQPVQKQHNLHSLPSNSQGILGAAPALHPSQATSLPNNNCTIEFDAFGFSVKDFLTRHILLRCDSSGDLYPVTKPSTVPAAFVSTSSSTWHQRLGHPGDDVLRSLSSRHLISCNKERSPHVCHACQLASGISMGLLMVGTASEKASEILVYAHETQHEKIIRGLALSIALTVYEREEEADTLIEQMTPNNKAIRQLLHFVVSDVSDDVRRTAVLALGFVLYSEPEQFIEIRVGVKRGKRITVKDQVKLGKGTNVIFSCFSVYK